MSKQTLLKLVGITYVLTLLLGGCAHKQILPGHDPEALWLLPDQTRMPKPDYQGKVILLRLVGDMTRQPVGAYIDFNYDNLTPVEQSYVIPNAGFVLFERMADTLAEQNATVYREYPSGRKANPTDLAGAIEIKVRVDDMEFHYYRTLEAGDYYLARAALSYIIQEPGKDAKKVRVMLRGKTTSTRCAFQHLSRMFSAGFDRRLRGLVPPSPKVSQGGK
jgi:hypothetical protein